MAMPLVPSYNTKRVYATWVKQGGAEMRPGTYKVVVPVRVTNATDDVIIPQGVYETGTLNVTPGVPSLDILVPCTDDTDNLPQGWQLHIEVTFNDAPGEKYVIDVPVEGPDINLRTIVLSETLPVPKDVLIVGAPGGIAPLGADTKVPAEFLPPISGGGVESWAEIEALPDAPTFHTVATTGAYTDLTGRPTIPSTAADVGAVPTTRTVNGKALSSNVTLDAADVSAVPTTRTVAGKPLSADVTLVAGDVGAVPTSRTVAGKPLTDDVTLAASDVGAVPTTRTVAGKALSSNVTLTPSDVGVSTSSTTTAGLVELATTTEATTGTDTARAVTPAGLKAGLDARIGGGLVFLGAGPTPPDPSGLPDNHVWLLTGE